MKIIQSKFFKKWFNGLSNDIKGVILSHLLRIEYGHMQNCKPLKNANKIFELSIHFQKGYRLYFMREGKTVIVLINGGIKDDQKRDIEKAKRIKMIYENGGKIL
jgi:putative addiction module killer protein